jgi:ribokinase
MAHDLRHQQTRTHDDRRIVRHHEGVRVSAHVVVVGQAARDLVLRIAALPEADGAVPVQERIERLGGKGANQAVGLRQLLAGDADVRVTLVGVVGSDSVGDVMMEEARSSGIETDCVARRGRTALLVDVVADAGSRRLLEDVPREALLTAADIRRAADAFGSADAVILQLQQPAPTLLAAAALAVSAGAMVVLDGAVTGTTRAKLLARADVVRADAREAPVIADVAIRDRASALRAARGLLRGRTKVVALGVEGEGDVVAWTHGESHFPYGPQAAVDPTGGGDAFVAGLVTGLLRGKEPARAGRLAADAAAATVTRLGGRPDLTALAERSRG